MVKLLQLHVSGLPWVTYAAKVSQGRLNEDNHMKYTIDNYDSYGKHMYWLLSSVAHGHPALDYEVLLEFVVVRFLALLPRYVTHQLVRHRLATIVMESQRYSKDRVYRDKMCEETIPLVQRIAREAREAYLTLIQQGLPPERARAVLPECTQAVVLFQANLREILHIMTLRLSLRAQQEHALLWSQVAEALRDQYIPIAHLLILKAPMVYEEARRAGRIHSYDDERFAWLGTGTKPGMTAKQARSLATIINARRDLPGEFKSFAIRMARLVEEREGREKQ